MSYPQSAARNFPESRPMGFQVPMAWKWGGPTTGLRLMEARRAIQRVVHAIEGLDADSPEYQKRYADLTAAGRELVAAQEAFDERMAEEMADVVVLIVPPEGSCSGCSACATKDDVELVGP